MNRVKINFRCVLQQPKRLEGKLLFAEFELGGRLCKSWEGDCPEIEVTPNLELLVTFGLSLKGVYHELVTQFHYKLILN